MKKAIFILLSVLLTLTSCSDSFLDQYPSGGTLVQDQYDELDGTIQSSMLGVYSLMYRFGGDHDVFGQRSIDMYGDLLGQRRSDPERIPKSRSQFGLQAAIRLHEVGIASNRRSAYCGEYVPGPCTHRPSHHES